MNYAQGQAYHENLQAKLARARDEWEQQCAQRHEDRMNARREEQRAATQQRYEESARASQRKREDNLMKAEEMNYREKIWSLEEQMRLSKEAMRQQKRGGRMQADTGAAEMYVLADDMLRDMRKNNPQWEVRRQEAERRRAARTNSSESVRSDR